MTGQSLSVQPEQKADGDTDDRADNDRGADGTPHG
jgi:hypothetical protein